MFMSLRESLKALRASPVGPALNVPRRLASALPVARQSVGQVLKWTLTSREDTNYTYPITHQNTRHLAHAIAIATGSNVQLVSDYIKEAEADQQLKEHVIKLARTGPDRSYSDPRADFAKRLGWYAVARVIKPEIVIETGVDKGLGAVVLAAALLKNGRGRYYGTDIDPTAGRMLSGHYGSAGEILYGDSLESLAKFSGKVDLFINDSDHSADYEAREYICIAPKLSERAIVLGDNAHATDALMDWSERSGREFMFWSEKPVNHWYPGGGIGFSFTR
jgi:predicted O-methyltransferase YrrM